MTIFLKKGAYDAVRIIELAPENNRYTFTTESGEGDVTVYVTTSQSKSSNAPLFVHCHVYNADIGHWFTLRHKNIGCIGPTVPNVNEVCCECEVYMPLPWVGCTSCGRLAHARCLWPEDAAFTRTHCPNCNAHL